MESSSSSSSSSLSSSSSTLRLMLVSKCCKLSALIFVICLALYITVLGTGSYYLLSSNVLSAAEKLKAARVFFSKPSSESPLVVVLLSSTQRSGSTMLGELLATMGNSYYWFEPFKRINHTDCYNNRECSGEYLSVISKCILVGKNEYKKCSTTTSRVMKLVRGSLADVSVVLTQEYANVKMIHLTRDPRGSLNSIPHGWGSGGDNPTIRCKEINEDMEAYDQLQLMYPGRIMKVSYERFCIDTLGKTKEIYQFLYGNSKMPKKTFEYLESHTSGQSNGYFNTVRDTESHINEWREQIKGDFFYEIEKEPYCQTIIKKMGYRLFSSIDIVRNMSVSIFL